MCVEGLGDGNAREVEMESGGEKMHGEIIDGAVNAEAREEAEVGCRTSLNRRWNS